MALSIIKLHFLDPDTGEEHKKRYAVTDDSFTVLTAIEDGLQRLQVDIFPCQLHLKMVGQKNGSEKVFPVRMDDLIEMDHVYTFIDPEIKDSTLAANGSTTPPTTPRSPFVKSPATPTTPVSSRSAFGKASTAQTTPTSSRTPLVRQPVSFSSAVSPASTPVRPGIARIEAASPSGYMAFNSGTLSAANTPTGTPKYFALSKTKRITNFYVENVKDVEAFYDSKKAAPGRMFHEVNVVEQLGLFQHWRAAFFILCQQTNPELYEAAVYVLTEACFDILRTLWPKLNVTPADKQLLADIVSTLTGYSDLKNITLANRNGTLDFKVKHFRRRHPEALTDSPVPSAKRIKLTEKYQRVLWEKSLHVDATLTDGIITRLVSKFRHIQNDISLIQYDFKVLMSTRRQKVQSLSETFRRLVPAIFHIARDLRISEAQSTYDSPDDREIMAGSLLVSILKQKCGKSPLDYSRLVLDHSDSLDYKTVMEKRKAEKIIAPTILIIGSAPAVSFYIAADDMVFQVPGRFAEALQSYMELSFVSNVKYDKKTTGISHFFEYLMNIKEHQNTARMAVSKHLEAVAAELSKPLEPIDHQHQIEEASGSSQDHH